MIILFLAIFCTNGCVKQKMDVANLYINGVSDRTVKQGINRNLSLQLFIEAKSDSQKRITLSVEGLPTGMKDSFSFKAGVPDFKTTLYLTQTGITATGTYPLKIITTDASGNVQTASMNLIILESCTAKLVGKYKVTRVYKGISQWTRYVSADLDTTYSSETLRITDNESTATFALLEANCETKKIGNLGSDDVGYFTTAPPHIEYTTRLGPIDSATYIYTPL
ncbi:MAG TPA: hypothetical protein VL098_07560 [Flavipsychrobacter sp.]|nr:hypothetical protein [Flavipsychrobacter sp.]